jgi:predicted SAM-dependent methyltransferase
MTLKQKLKAGIANGPIPLELVREIKAETHLSMVRLRTRISPKLRRRASELAALREVKLNFGCGPRILPGWLNIDGWWTEGIDYVCDLRQPLPLSDGSCRYIFTEHCFEHIDRQFRSAVIREWSRLLCPSGVLRIVGPGCAQFAEAYLRRDVEWFRNVNPEIKNSAEGLNEIFRNHFHRFIDDFESLSSQLKAQGFRRVEESGHLSSRVPELRVDLDEPSRVPGNLYVEASK